MTDRVHSLLVVLEKDYREDDVQSLIEALAHMRGVAGVEKFKTGADSLMAEVRADQKWRDRLIGLLNSRE